jgi:hypothetical protein
VLEGMEAGAIKTGQSFAKDWDGEVTTTKPKG